MRVEGELFGDRESVNRSKRQAWEENGGEHGQKHDGRCHNENPLLSIYVNFLGGKIGLLYLKTDSV